MLSVLVSRGSGLRVAGCGGAGKKGIRLKAQGIGHIVEFGIWKKNF
jgi:hypothetical protein